MREIKFRAWDKTRKEFLSAGRILLAIHAGKNPDDCTVFLDEPYGANKYKDRFDIEQFTGLLDKNGKEIYEGDILKYSSIHSDEHMMGGEKTIGVVNWHDGRCGFVPQDVVENVRGGNYMTPWDFAKDIEIIGNIHENPELKENKLWVLHRN